MQLTVRIIQYRTSHFLVRSPVHLLEKYLFFYHTLSISSIYNLLLSFLLLLLLIFLYVYNITPHTHAYTRITSTHLTLTPIATCFTLSPGYTVADSSCATLYSGSLWQRPQSWATTTTKNSAAPRRLAQADLQTSSCCPHFDAAAPSPDYVYYSTV